MRCHKAKAKIEMADWTDPELADHLKICPSCAKLAQAQSILDSAAKTVKNQTAFQPSDLSVIKANLAARQSQKELSFMSKVRNTFASHRGLGFGLASVAVILLFLTLVPLPYQRIAGYDVSFAGVEGVVSGDQMQKAMSAIGHRNVPIKVVASENGVNYEFQSLQSLQAAKEVATAFAALTKTKVSPQIMPNIETVSASLYAQAREKERRVEIEVNGEGKTDEQIKAEIEAKLAAQGLGCTLVYIKTDSTGGSREIKLQIEEAEKCAPGSAGPTIEIDARGKTDEQVKSEIEAKMAAQGHPDAQVIIHSEGADSTRKLEIRIEDTDTTKH
jgi:hypothetical protein